MTGRPGEKSCCPIGWSLDWIRIRQVVGLNSQPMVFLHLLPIPWMMGAELEPPRFMLLSWTWMPDALLRVHLRGELVFLCACLVQLGTALACNRTGLCPTDF